MLGVDISEAMLKLARKRAPETRFKRGSLFRTRVPKCAAVTAIGECANYLFDPGGTALLGTSFGVSTAHFFLEEEECLFSTLSNRAVLRNHLCSTAKARTGRDSSEQRGGCQTASSHPKNDDIPQSWTAVSKKPRDASAEAVSTSTSCKETKDCGFRRFQFAWL